MKVIIGIAAGFIVGCFFTAHQVLEAPNGLAVKLIQFTRAIWGAL
jgi:hypothetical protein